MLVDEVDHVIESTPTRRPAVQPRRSPAPDKDRAGLLGNLGRAQTKLSQDKFTHAAAKLTDVDLFDPDVYLRGIPHDTFALLRREAVVYRHQRTGLPPFWAITRYPGTPNFGAWYGSGDPEWQRTPQEATSAGACSPAAGHRAERPVPPASLELHTG